MQDTAQNVLDAIARGELTGPHKTLETVAQIAHMASNLSLNINAGADHAQHLLEMAPNRADLSQDDETTVYVTLMLHAIENGDTNEFAAFDASHGADNRDNPLRLMGYRELLED